jgi:hypothetical protein
VRCERDQSEHERGNVRGLNRGFRGCQRLLEPESEDVTQVAPANSPVRDGQSESLTLAWRVLIPGPDYDLAPLVQADFPNSEVVTPRGIAPKVSSLRPSRSILRTLGLQK